MKYCRHCGEQLEDSDKFCITCGAPCDESTSSNDSKKKLVIGNLPSLFIHTKLLCVLIRCMMARVTPIVALVKLVSDK